MRLLQFSAMSLSGGAVGCFRAIMQTSVSVIALVVCVSAVFEFAITGETPSLYLCVRVLVCVRHVCLCISRLPAVPDKKKTL